MAKTILITGSTDGIGLLTAQILADEGHHILLHGRSTDKLTKAAEEVGHGCETYAADLSDIAQVRALANAVRAKHDTLDVLINNAGVLKVPQTPGSALDIRFMVNTIAPYALTQALLPIIPADGRIINLSSAAQAPVDLAALSGQRSGADMDMYAQSKLALTIFTREMAAQHPSGPVMVAVNPGSLLASKMVKEGFGVAGNDLSIGANILKDAALSEDFADKSGQYFDNDAGRFAQPHSAALNADHSADVMRGIEETLAKLTA